MVSALKCVLAQIPQKTESEVKTLSSYLIGQCNPREVERRGTREWGEGEHVPSGHRCITSTADSCDLCMASQRLDKFPCLRRVHMVEETMREEFIHNPLLPSPLPSLLLCLSPSMPPSSLYPLPLFLSFFLTLSLSFPPSFHWLIHSFGINLPSLLTVPPKPSQTATGKVRHPYVFMLARVPECLTLLANQCHRQSSLVAVVAATVTWLHDFGDSAKLSQGYSSQKASRQICGGT